MGEQREMGKAVKSTLQKEMHGINRDFRRGLVHCGAIMGGGEWRVREKGVWSRGGDQGGFNYIGNVFFIRLGVGSWMFILLLFILFCGNIPFSILPLPCWVILGKSFHFSLCIYKIDDNISKFYHHNSPLSFFHHVSHSDKLSGQKTQNCIYWCLNPFYLFITIFKKAWAQQAMSSLAGKGWLIGNQVQMGRSSQAVRELTVHHGPILTN